MLLLHFSTHIQRWQLEILPGQVLCLIRSSSMQRLAAWDTGRLVLFLCLQLTGLVVSVVVHNL
jgi:hypothetical protein